MVTLPPLPPLPIIVESLEQTHGFSRHSHWIIPRMLMQGAHPNLKGRDSSTSNDLDLILNDAGCTTFLSLIAECRPEPHAVLVDDGGCLDWETAEPPNLASYSDQVRSATSESSTPPRFFHYGIRNCRSAKSIEGLLRLVSELKTLILSGETVYLHCFGGKGRSGLVSACLLMEFYELDAESALSYVDALCRTRGGERCNSPETEEQKDQAREFYGRLRASGG